MAGIRVGIVPYLNAKPLFYPLITGEIKHDLTLIEDSPAGLADALARQELDIAMIPTIEYVLGDNYRIIPGIGISSLGAVKSVLLYSKLIPPAIYRVALDESSRTSAALVKVLLSNCFGIHPEYCTSPPHLSNMLTKADAALLIGDQALMVPRNGYHCIDLGALWQAYTGMSFVFALLAVRKDVDAGEAVNILLAAKALGLTQIPQIARAEAAKLGISPEVCLDYLQNRIQYELQDEQLQALVHFYQMAGVEGLIPEEVHLKFYR